MVHNAWIRLLTASLLAICGADVALGTRTVGLLNGDRSFHTATLLPSGKVLVVGGTRRGVGPLASAELFDPSLGRWEIAGSLNTPRLDHTATLLPSGKVLVVGGTNNLSNKLESAEIYDPATGLWSATSPTFTGHIRHTVTLLKSGKVLLIGNGAIELYDPALNSWTYTPTFEADRYEHTATLLQSGKILVVGGRNAQGAATPQSFIFDPGTESLISTGQPSTARTSHAATLLQSGEVILIGGASPCIGSYCNTRLASVEIYNPQSGTWRQTTSLYTGRNSIQATLLPTGAVFIAGTGFSGEGAHPYTYMEFDPYSAIWKLGSTEFTWSYGHTLTLLDSGHVLLAGGSWPEASELIVPSSLTYSMAIGANLPTPTINHSATLLPSGDLAIIGGEVPVTMQMISNVQVLNSASNTWSYGSNLVNPRGYHVATLLKSGNVLIAGGVGGGRSGELVNIQNGTSTNLSILSLSPYYHSGTLLPSGNILYVGPNPTDIMEFNPESQETIHINGETIPKYDRHTATLLRNGKVLIVGGAQTSTTKLYNPKNKQLSQTGSMISTQRGNHTATLLPSGKVLVVGGRLGNGSTLSSVELYDPSTETWEPKSSLSTARQNHSATLLPTGEVLIAGGAGEWPGTFTDSIEIYSPATNQWRSAGQLLKPRAKHTATLLKNGSVVFAGGHRGSTPAISDTEILVPILPAVRPTILSAPTIVSHGDTLTLTGLGFGPSSEASGSGTRNSASNYPIIRLRPLDGCCEPSPAPKARNNFSDEPMTIATETLPNTLNPGYYFLSISSNGAESLPVLLQFNCSVAIVQSPSNEVGSIGSTATFTVKTQGARLYQWQKNGFEIPGATSASYTTPPVTAADAGSTYRVVVDSGCMSATSSSAVLTISDNLPPTTQVVDPSGGEYWQLSSPSVASTQTITWSMSDNVRICKVEASLLYSRDSGQTWITAPAGGGLPKTFGQDGACPYPGVEQSNLSYTVPQSPPSGSVGSLYKIQIRATDQAGNSTSVRSANPFFLVQPNPDAVRTLILHNLPRMQSVQGISATDVATLRTNLANLANHPQVAGHLVDLSLVSTLSLAYSTWDADSGNITKANNLVGALRQYLRSQIFPTYSGVRSIVIVGDDRIFPMARLPDMTALPESAYFLSTSTTVGKALEQNYFLSDDPIGVLGSLELPISNSSFNRGAFLADLAVGRLVESPAEIVRTISTFISQAGLLDLATRPNRKVAVSGYDFLSDSALRINEKWQGTLSSANVDGQLIGQNWTASQLKTKLGSGFGIYSLNGHATHYEEGVPGSSPAQIIGLDASEIYGPHSCGNRTGVDLAGSVIYAVGCHGGLPVAGSCSTAADRTLDLPQTFLARGALAYLANSGYGWGLKNGLGFAERLVEIFTEELLAADTVALGDAFVRAKKRYFLEQPGFDVYDRKTLLQWTFFGLPMYAVKTGIAAGVTSPSPMQEALDAGFPTVEEIGDIKIERQLNQTTSLTALPDHLLTATLQFNLSAAGLYNKYNSSGASVTAAGCPDSRGCYYTLNGLSSNRTATSGTPDIPIQPYLINYSRIAGTSQHGVLWLGGDYREEGGWVPLMAELMSNGGVFSNHGAAPRLIRPKPYPLSTGLGESPLCRPSDLELNSLVAVTGEALKSSDGSPTYDRQRLYQNMSYELLYFNDGGLGGNCDREGPTLSPGAGTDYHLIHGSRIDWAVGASDAAGVWRVVVVYDSGADANGLGRWEKVELTVDNAGIWRGSKIVSTPSLTYLIQAVDRRGNVEWVDFIAPDVPPSLVAKDLPLPLEARPDGRADLALSMVVSRDPARLGEIFNYSLLVQNLGPSAANQITLVDTLPAALQYRSSEGEGWSCLQNASTVTCSYSSLAPGATASPLLIYVDPLEWGTFSNQASVSALEADIAAANNSTTQTTRVTSAADLAVVLSDYGARAIPGAELTYSITVSNLATNGVFGATLDSTFPSVLSAVSWTCSPSPGSTCSPAGSGNLAESLDLAPGGSVVFLVSAQVEATATGTISHTATVSNPAGDPAVANNSSTTLTPVLVASAVKTLILHNLGRMGSLQGIGSAEADSLRRSLASLAWHSKVLGRLVDLGSIPALNTAYAAWDNNPGNALLANALVLALRQQLKTELLPAYPNVNSIVLVGDDRIFPMARLADTTGWSESHYLLATSSTVASALAQNNFLSDDPLGVRGSLELPLTGSSLDHGAFLPDLPVGRLVETPAEIAHTISTFISRNGLLDLDAYPNRKVLVSGYDFFDDAAARSREEWQQALGQPQVDALLGSGWSAPELKQKLAALFGIYQLGGHANHHLEGTPITGLEAAGIYGPHACGNQTGVDLSGALVYSSGFHGGLPVPGSCATDADSSLDLPQTYLARGAAAYIASTGYGWALKRGTGLSEDLLQIFGEELRSAPTVVLGETLLRAKRRYFLEQPGLDIYDHKTVMQWTFFGLPMYTLRTGVSAPPLSTWNEPAPPHRAPSGPLAALPDHLSQITRNFDFSGPNKYQKYDSRGNRITVAGCPDVDGCYYRLHEQKERSTDLPDLPIQPYFVYDSRQLGTSQHGALWLGGEYREENFNPVRAELVSNGGDFSNPGAAPRLIHHKPVLQKTARGSAPSCLVNEQEISSLVVVTGEALKSSDGSPTYDRQRLYQNMNFELLYFNDGGLGGNCDREGPSLSPGAGTDYHLIHGSRIDWAVGASDAAGVWRVVVVYDSGADANGLGRWEKVDLAVDNAGIWRGSKIVSTPSLTYLIQAVDRRGNVEWVDFVAPDLPPSLVAKDLPLPLEASLGAQADLRLTMSDSLDPVALGNVFAYNLVVHNLGPDSANQIRLVDPLPGALGFGGSGGGGWNCQHAAGTVTCELPSLAAGASATLPLFVHTLEWGFTSNQASVSALETDPSTSNNTATEATFVAGTPGDLAISLSALDPIAILGETLGYVITATNRGGHLVRGAQVTDLFPLGLSPVVWSCSASAGSSCPANGSGNIDHSVDLQPGGTVTYQVLARVGASGDQFLNVATITSALDPVTANNRAEVTSPFFDPLLLFQDGFESGDTSAWASPRVMLELLDGATGDSNPF